MRQTKAEAERGEWPVIRQNIEARAGNYEARLAVENSKGGTYVRIYERHMESAVRLWDVALRNGFVCC